MLLPFESHGAMMVDLGHRVIAIFGVLRRLLSNKIVDLSEPFPYGRSWAYMFADEIICERRIFETEGEAIEHLTLTKSGLSVGAAFISVRQLPLKRIREIQDVSDVSYSGGVPIPRQ